MHIGSKMSVRISNYPVRVISVAGPDARTLGVKTLWMIPSRKWSEAETLGSHPTFVWREAAKGLNPTTMARAQVQRLNWLNSLWKEIWKTAFHLLDAADTLNWVLMPFHILFPSFSASLLLRAFGGWWLLPVLMTQFSQVVVPHKSQRCFFFLLFLFLLLTDSSSSCFAPGRRWSEGMKGMEWFSGGAACCF